jgi:hypothetical protein
MGTHSLNKEIKKKIQKFLAVSGRQVIKITEGAFSKESQRNCSFCIK